MSNVFNYNMKHGNAKNVLNMAVLFWYLVKIDASVRYCTVAYTWQCPFYKVPCTTNSISHMNVTIIFDILYYYIIAGPKKKLYN